MEMEPSRDQEAFYFEVWGWLVALLTVGTVVVLLPVPRFVTLSLVFGVAAVKGVLVVRNYMHLKREHLIFYLIAGIPFLLVVAMLLALLPDIAFHH